MGRGRYHALAVGFAALCALTATYAQASVFQATPINISSNSGYDDAPAVFGDRVVWTARDGYDWEIYTWAVGDTAPTNVSMNSGASDYEPQISGDRVVWWEGEGGGDSEIYTWAVGDTAPTNVSKNGDVDDYDAQISGDRVVWARSDGNDSEIYTWAVGDASPTNISKNSGADDYWPQISGDRVVWARSDGNDSEIYTWAVGDAAPTNISKNSGVVDELPQISGNRVVWEGEGGGDYEIYTWAVGDTAPTNISKNSGSDDYACQVSGERVVWTRAPGNHSEIYTWAVGDLTPTNISNNDERDGTPMLSADRVVWFREGLNDCEVYTWRAGDDAPTNISKKGTSDDLSPRISGDRVAWVDNAYGDGEIYTAVLAVGTSATTLSAELPATSSYRSAQMTGYLSGGSDDPAAGRRVQIQYLVDGQWKDVGNPTRTGESGKFARTVAPQTTTSYRAVFLGDASYAASASTTMTVKPKAQLTRKTDWVSPTRYKTYTAWGYIEPKHPTSDSNEVKIKAYKKGADGDYHYAKSFTASYAYYSSSKTKYKASVKFSPGRWRIRAYHATDSKNYKTYGSYDYFAVE